MNHASKALVLAALVEIAAIVSAYLIEAAFRKLGISLTNGFMLRYGLCLYLLPLATVILGVRLMLKGKEHLVPPLIFGLAGSVLVLMVILILVMGRYARAPL